jgi:hypothetical protein
MAYRNNYEVKPHVLCMYSARGVAYNPARRATSIVGYHKQLLWFIDQQTDKACQRLPGQMCCMPCMSHDVPCDAT